MKNKLKEPKRHEVTHELVLHTELGFSKIQNAHNVAIALCSAGYFTRILDTSGSYIVLVFKYKK